ncbi:response regulator [Flavobacteriales bacterium]|nr:response regulator [Flavobacteriales bacterium]
MSKKELKIKPKILYVDDESINLTLFKVSFKSDYMIQTSSSGEEALEILNKNQHFDIIISDQRMPGLTGTEFMIKAKKKSPNCKFILLTGYTDIEALEKAINEIGIWQYVKKPWEPSNLKFIINKAFSNLQAEKENIIISSALKKNEERLNLALTGTNVGIWDWNLETNEIYFSPTWKEMLGYKSDELENKLQTWETILHKDDLQKYFNHLNNYVSGRNATYEIELKLKHKNGQFIHILSRAKGHKNKSDEYIRLTGTNIDLTEKVKATNKEVK